MPKACKRTTTKKQSPEKRLSNYWKEKNGLEYSDFDGIIGNAPRGLTRGTGLNINIMGEPNSPIRFAEITGEISNFIWKGFPLSFQEYHIAIALGLLLTELPYEEFYTTCWFENEIEHGYKRVKK